MNEPQISLTGYLGADPEVRYTPNGVAVTDLRVASTRRFKVAEEWQDGETLWFTVTCWNHVAENAARSLKKGDKVTVAGRLTQQTWVREDGTSSVKLIIDASTVGVDLGRYPVRVEKPVRAGSGADALSDKWADHETGRLVGAPPGDQGPLAPVEGEEPGEQAA